MATETLHMSIYEGSALIAIIETEPKKAWRAAREYVRAMAHADGVEGPEEFSGTPGRWSVKRGIYRAVNTTKLDR